MCRKWWMMPLFNCECILFSIVAFNSISMWRLCYRIILDLHIQCVCVCVCVAFLSQFLFLWKKMGSIILNSMSLFIYMWIGKPCIKKHGEFRKLQLSMHFWNWTKVPPIYENEQFVTQCSIMNNKKNIYCIYYIYIHTLPIVLMFWPVFIWWWRLELTSLLQM